MAVNWGVDDGLLVRLKHRKENKDMDVDVLISIVDEISCELERIRETDGAAEEEWFQDNLEQAHDLLSQVKDLIGA